MERIQCNVVGPPDSPISMRLCSSLESAGIPARFVHRYRPAVATSAAELALVPCDDRDLAEASGWISEALQQSAALMVIAVGERLRRESILSLLDAGAHDFVSAEASGEELIARVQRLALEPRATSRAPAPDHDELSRHGLIGTSACFVREIDKLRRYAQTDATVLIVGETGTGKELCAQAIHYLSARSAQPCVAINCGALQNELADSELFGHVKGAYTTAHSARLGLIHEAQGGSLFLDDIDCLSLATQAKLLRFLQEREYRMVGSNLVQTADIRVIAATNKTLSESVRCGEFRRDLYFRLNVLSLSLPPLRERREDLLPLALRFMRMYAMQLKRDVRGIAPCAARLIAAYDWPGNVRELKHVIERAVLLARKPTLDSEDILIDGAHATQADESFRAAKARAIDQFERSYLEGLLAANLGNVTHAARVAQKNRRAFFELMRKHGIVSARFHPRDQRGDPRRG